MRWRGSCHILGTNANRGGTKSLQNLCTLLASTQPAVPLIRRQKIACNHCRPPPTSTSNMESMLYRLQGPTSTLSPSSPLSSCLRVSSDTEEYEYEHLPQQKNANQIQFFLHVLTGISSSVYRYQRAQYVGFARGGTSTSRRSSTPYRIRSSFKPRTPAHALRNFR